MYSSKLARWLDTSSKFALFSVSGLKDKKLIKKASLHNNWNMQTLFWSRLNISAKFHQNRSLKFWTIPFQSWRVFWDTVYTHIFICVVCTLYCRAWNRFLCLSSVYDLFYCRHFQSISSKLCTVVWDPKTKTEFGRRQKSDAIFPYLACSMGKSFHGSNVAA